MGCISSKGGAKYVVYTEEETREKYKEAMSGKFKNWDPTKAPPLAILAESPDISKSMKLAEEHGLEGPIMEARHSIQLALFTMQCAVCTAVGDARTSHDEKVRPAGHPCWDRNESDTGGQPGDYHWESANKPSMPGYELGKLVIDAIIALKANPAVAALGDLTTQLTTIVFATIPSDVGAEIPNINTHPVQDMLRSAPFAGKEIVDYIPMADWTATITREVKAAIAKLKSGDFGNPATFHKIGGRRDFVAIMYSIDKLKTITPSYYLIACGVNRFKTFHGKASTIVAAVVGTKYSEGPVKNKDRVAAKCLPGGDYYSNDAAKKPQCMYVLDILRGTVTCTSHDMMLEVRAEAVEVFGQHPAVLKDRRMKPQHDMLLVFEVDGMYCELQLHYEQTMCIKSLMHAIFEIQRLTTGDEGKIGSVTSSGLDTVMYVPANWESASTCKVFLHI